LRFAAHLPSILETRFGEDPRVGLSEWPEQLAKPPTGIGPDAADSDRMMKEGEMKSRKMDIEM
jgi:hypothetical protein